jgi:hypothetical protein
MFWTASSSTKKLMQHKSICHVIEPVQAGLPDFRDPNVKNVPNDPKLYQTAISYTKWP